VTRQVRCRAAAEPPRSCPCNPSGQHPTRARVAGASSSASFLCTVSCFSHQSGPPPLDQPAQFDPSVQWPSASSSQQVPAAAASGRQLVPLWSSGGQATTCRVQPVSKKVLLATDLQVGARRRRSGPTVHGSAVPRGMHPPAPMRRAATRRRLHSAPGLPCRSWSPTTCNTPAGLPASCSSASLRRGAPSTSRCVGLLTAAAAAVHGGRRQTRRRHVGQRGLPAAFQRTASRQLLAAAPMPVDTWWDRRSHKLLLAATSFMQGAASCRVASLQPAAPSGTPYRVGPSTRILVTSASAAAAAAAACPSAAAQQQQQEAAPCSASPSPSPARSRSGQGSDRPASGSRTPSEAGSSRRGSRNQSGGGERGGGRAPAPPPAAAPARKQPPIQASASSFAVLGSDDDA